MKWLFVLFLAIVIFGGAGYFGYQLVVKPEIAVREEQRQEAPPPPRPEFGRAEFETAKKLKDDGKLAEARGAFYAYIQRFGSGSRTEEAKDLLGEVNVAVLLSRYPVPEKQEYIVKRGDVLARVAHKTKSTPELIMRMNNLSGTMLRIGDRLLTYSPDFTLNIERATEKVVLLDRGVFFKQYPIKEMKLPPKPPPNVNTRVVDIMAWKGGKRIGFGSKEYLNTARWIRLASPNYTLYSVSDASGLESEVTPPPTGFGLAARDLLELSSLVKKQTPVTIKE